MPNLTPAGGPASILDFSSELETLNALRRDNQLGRVILGPSVLSVTFSASTLFGVVMQGSATISFQDVTASYAFPANTVAVFSPGLPLGHLPPGGSVTATMSTTGSQAVLLYK